MKRYGSIVILLAVFISMATMLYLFRNEVSSMLSNKNIVSEIKTLENGKKIIFVEGLPFQTYGIQVRVDTWRRYAGVSNEQMSQKGLFGWARDLNANCAQVPISWREIEPVQGEYDWTNLDWAIDECAGNNLKMEIVWFGSDVCGSGWSQLLPDYIINGAAQYQRILKSDGEVLGAGYKSGEGDKISLCREDPDLIREEQRVISALMEHMDSFDKANVVIGFQVENEPTIVQHGHPAGLNQIDRCYCPTCSRLFSKGSYESGLAFSKERLAVYLNQIAAAVKGARRQIYTRVNFITAFDMIDESIPITRKLAPNVDFIGFDNYGKSQYHNYNILATQFTIDGNIPHVAEQEGAALDCRQKIIDVLAANGCGSEVYRLAEAVTGTDNFLLDANGKDARLHTQEVRDTFGMLRKVMSQLTLKKNGKGDEIQYFNCMGYTKKNYTGSKKLLEMDLTYQTKDTGIGIGFVDGNYMTLLSAKGGTFTVTGINPSICEYGYYDENGIWVVEGNKQFQSTVEGTVTIELLPYEIARILSFNP